MVRREKNSPKVAPAKSSRLEEIVASQRVLLQEISGSEINLDLRHHRPFNSHVWKILNMQAATL